MLRLHTSRRSRIPLYQLRQRSPARMGSLRRLFSCPNPGPPRPEEESRPVSVEVASPALVDGALRTRPGPPQQARAETQPRVPSRTWHVVSSRSIVLLRPLHRQTGHPVFVHGRRVGGNRDRSSHVRGYSSFAPSVAPVQVGVRVKGIPRRRLRQTRVGRTCDRLSLRPVRKRILVRRFCDSPCSSGRYLCIYLFI